MSAIIQLPPDVERQLREADPRLDDHARERFIVSGYREGNLSTGDVAINLGFSTWGGAEQWLGTRGIDHDYSLADLEADGRMLEGVLHFVNSTSAAGTSWTRTASGG